MGIDVERMESWIGADVFAGSEEKIGKVEDVYFVAGEPVVVGISSGLAGRKHHVATLRDAAVTFDGVRLALGQDSLVKTDGDGLSETQISALSSHDDRVAGLQPDQIEGWRHREQRMKEAADAKQQADALDSDVRERAEAEAKAVSRVHDAESDAARRRHEREEAEAQAAAAHAAAEQLGR